MELGYRETQQGSLTAGQAKQLYGHESALTSWRLQNGNAHDHGLVRVMQWQQPANAGLGNALPLAIGSRWFASLVQDIYEVADAFNDDNAQAGGWVLSQPVRGIEGIGQPATSFYQRFTGVREFFVIGAETRQAFFQRYNYTRLGYGTISPQSPLKVSEGTHSSIVTANHETATFYADVLGLQALEMNPKRSGYQNVATRQILMLEDGQEFYLSGFMSPQSTVGMFQVYTPLYPTPDLREFSQPGSLGLSLLTYQVEEIQTLHDRVAQSDASGVSTIIQNEFNELSFGFFAPDGMYWTIVGKVT
jgi:hypothetical protein